MSSNVWLYGTAPRYVVNAHAGSVAGQQNGTALCVCGTELNDSFQITCATLLSMVTQRKFLSVPLPRIVSMSSSTREEVIEVFGALDADLDRLCGLSFEILTTPERLRGLERLETVARRLRTPGHALINQLAEQASEEELGGKLSAALANRLRISRPDANRRIAEAAELGERRALTGETLAPQLSATSEAQRDGLIGTSM
jgi:hypothetical protein